MSAKKEVRFGTQTDRHSVFARMNIKITFNTLAIDNKETTVYTVIELSSELQR